MWSNAHQWRRILFCLSGTAKIGSKEYESISTAAPPDIAGLNQLPIKSVGTSTIYIHDVGWVRDGFPPSKRTLCACEWAAVGSADDSEGGQRLDARCYFRHQVAAFRRSRQPAAGTRHQAAGDQSVFVRASIDGVIKEATMPRADWPVILIFLEAGAAL